MKAIFLGFGSIFLAASVTHAGPISIAASFTGSPTSVITSNDKGSTFGVGWKVLSGGWRVNDKKLLEGQLQGSDPVDVLVCMSSQYQKKVEASVTVTASEFNKFSFAGIMFGFQDLSTYYVLRVCINGTESGLQVIKERKSANGYDETCLGGTLNFIGADVNLAVNTAYRLTIRQSGSGEIQFELTDITSKSVLKSGSFKPEEPIPSGYVGLLATAPLTLFKDFKATLD